MQLLRTFPELGQKYEPVCRITDRDLKRTPRWDPAEGKPPVTVGKAIRKATKEFKRVREQPEGTYWMMESASLKPASLGNPATLKHRWMWVVTWWLYNDAGLSGQPIEINVVVLLDGRVVPLVAEPFEVEPAIVNPGTSPED